MKTKIIMVALAVISFIVFSGCTGEPTAKSEGDGGMWCEDNGVCRGMTEYDYPNYFCMNKQKIIEINSKCNCFNDKLNYSISLGMSSELNPSQKAELAPLGNHWFCLCNRIINRMTCIDNESSIPDKYRNKQKILVNETINDTFELTFEY